MDSGTNCISQMAGTRKDTEKWISTNGTFMFAAGQIPGHYIDAVSLYHEI